MKHIYFRRTDKFARVYSTNKSDECDNILLYIVFVVLSVTGWRCNRHERGLCQHFQRSCTLPAAVMVADPTLETSQTLVPTRSSCDLIVRSVEDGDFRLVVIS